MLSVYQEDVRDLADNLNNARLLLRSLTNQPTLPPETRPAWAPLQQPQIYLRVLDRDGRTLVETPGMSDELAPPNTEELASTAEPNGNIRQLTSRSGKPLVALLVRVSSENSSEATQYLQAAMDRDHDDYLLAHYRERLWVVLGVSLALCFLVGYGVARTGMLPLERIIKRRNVLIKYVARADPQWRPVG